MRVGTGRRPASIRPGWWRLGLALHGVLLLAVVTLIALGPAAPALTVARERLGALGRRADAARSAVNLGAAPDFTLTTFDGEDFRLADQRGKVVVVNFWASWCVPCRQEAPRFAAADATYRGQGIVFVGVNIQDNAADARAFLTEFGLAYVNGPDRTGAIVAAYGVGGIPATFFIDRAGQIRQRWLGEIQADQLMRFIAEARR